MKAHILLLAIVLILSGIQCSTSKKLGDLKLFDSTWELEYISGPRIAFEGLFPDKKPYLTFNRDQQMAEGSNGCNGYRASFKIKGPEISFGEPGPTTMMYCGEGEQVFLKTIKKVNRYSIDPEGKLNLLMDEVSMMRFKPKDG